MVRVDDDEAGELERLRSDAGDGKIGRDADTPWLGVETVVCEQFTEETSSRRQAEHIKRPRAPQAASPSNVTLCAASVVPSALASQSRVSRGPSYRALARFRKPAFMPHSTHSACRALFHTPQSPPHAHTTLSHLLPSSSIPLHLLYADTCARSLRL